MWVWPPVACGGWAGCLRERPGAIFGAFAFSFASNRLLAHPMGTDCVLDFVLGAGTHQQTQCVRPSSVSRGENVCQKSTNT